MQKNILIAIVGIVIVGVGITYFTTSSTNKVSQVSTEERGTNNSPSENSMMDDSHILGVVMKSGSLLTVWTGDELTVLDHDITLKNGTKAGKGGAITSSDGKAIVLKDGQELKADGSIITVDVSKMIVMEAKMGEGAGMQGDEVVNKGGATMAQVGSYVAYSPEKIALANKGPVILFFHANWCPTCIALDKDIKAHLSDIPENVTILDVDYDSSQALKVKYGVTVQHTLVQVDADGNLIKTWRGSMTLADFLTQVKK